MFRASSCPSSGATTTEVAGSGLPSELGDSSAVGCGRADRPDRRSLMIAVLLVVVVPTGPTTTNSTAITKL
jgi:hypothetical protein